MSGDIHVLGELEKQCGIKFVCVYLFSGPSGVQRIYTSLGGYRKMKNMEETNNIVTIFKINRGLVDR